MSTPPKRTKQLSPPPPTDLTKPLADQQKEETTTAANRNALRRKIREMEKARKGKSKGQAPSSVLPPEGQVQLQQLAQRLKGKGGVPPDLDKLRDMIGKLSANLDGGL